MIVYLAAAYSRREEMCDVRAELKAIGVTVNSRWLDETLPAMHHNFDRFLRENALIDLADVRSADTLVRFSDPEVVGGGNTRHPKDALVPSYLASGARMFEMGVALQAGKAVVVVGGNQNVFDRLPHVAHVADLEALKEFLHPYRGELQ